MTKTAILGTLAALAALVVTGCSGGASGGGQSTGARGKTLNVGIVFDSGGIGDKSFNDSANRGIDRAVKELGIKKNPVNSKSIKDFEANLTALAQRGCEIIFAVGITQENALKNVAPKFPNVKFAIIDGSGAGDNVRSLRFAEHEGSFLAGYTAALASKTGKIGFVGGMEIPLIKKFFAGYKAGAMMANPTIQVLPEKYTGSWDNVDAGLSSANVLFSQGADIVYHAAGRAGIGVINAAKQQGKLAIGVDSDQDDEAPGFVLTSMVKKVDEAVFETIKDVQAGNFTAGEKVYDLKSNGVGLTEMKHTKDKLPSDAMAKIEQVRKDIIDGKIKVPSTPQELDAFLAAMKK